MTKYLLLSLMCVGSMQASSWSIVDADGYVHPVASYNTAEVLRDMPYDKVQQVVRYLAFRPFMDDRGDFHLDAHVRGCGGGPVTGQVLYWATKSIGYSVAGAGAAAAATAAATAVAGTGGAAAPLVAAAASAASAAATAGAGSAVATTIGVAAGSAAIGTAAGVVAGEVVVATSMAGGTIAAVPLLIESTAVGMGAFGALIVWLP
jgi:hypothetical protein